MKQPIKKLWSLIIILKGFKYVEDSSIQFQCVKYSQKAKYYIAEVQEVVVGMYWRS